jgi:tetratricopeptide (TPR) repeat protein
MQEQRTGRELALVGNHVTADRPTGVAASWPGALLTAVMDAPADPRPADPMPAGPRPADPLPGAALALRDEALAELDQGDAEVALALAGAALAVLEAAGQGGGIDAAAVLVTLAEAEEATGRFADATATAVGAIAILDGVTPQRWDDDVLLLWCQAQERLAGLERMAGAFGRAADRLAIVLERASSVLGETCRPVVSAANALALVHMRAGNFGAAEAAYRQATAAAGREPGP